MIANFLLVHKTYEAGTVSRNVGIQNSFAGESPKGKITTALNEFQKTEINGRGDPLR